MYRKLKKEIHHNVVSYLRVTGVLKIVHISLPFLSSSQLSTLLQSEISVGKINKNRYS